VATGASAATRLPAALTSARRAAGQEPRAVLAIIGIAMGSTLLVLGLAAPPLSAAFAHRPLALVEFCLVAVALAWTPVQIYGRGSFTFAGAGLLAASFELGVGAGMVGAVLVATVILVRSGGLLHRAAFNAATLALSTAAGGGVFALAVSVDTAGPRKLLAAVGAGAAFYVVNITLLSVAMGASEGISPLDVLKERFRWLAPYYLASGALALAVALAFERLGVGGLAAFAVPPAFMMLSTTQYLERTRASVEEVRRTNGDLADLLRVTSGLAPRAHDLRAIADFAERELGAITGGIAELSTEQVRDAVPLAAGGNTVAWLRLQAFGEGAERWDRIKDALVPSLATTLENAALIDRVIKGNRDLVAALSRSLEAKDFYTGGHTERVAELSVALAKRLGFEGSDLEAIEIGALVHDVGKVGVPEAILNKPGPLDESEWEVMRRHPIISDFILKDVDLHPFVRQAARWSHERVDGTGYPDGLSGDTIPLPARIVLVADAWDALTSDRPYRPRRTASQALEEIRRNVGTQFCPTVFGALEAEYDDASSLLHATDPAVGLALAG
jgi:HD-GYP domain-containing protein (c-di-GMP phosphodiesterase class II)